MGTAPRGSLGNRWGQTGGLRLRAQNWEGVALNLAHQRLALISGSRYTLHALAQTHSHTRAHAPDSCPTHAHSALSGSAGPEAIQVYTMYLYVASPHPPHRSSYHTELRRVRRGSLTVWLSGSGWGRVGPAEPAWTSCSLPQPANTTLAPARSCPSPAPGSRGPLRPGPRPWSWWPKAGSHLQALHPPPTRAKAQGLAIPVLPASHPISPQLRGHACPSSCQESSYQEAQALWAPSLGFLALVLGEGQAEITERGLFRQSEVTSPAPGTDTHSQG